MQSLSPEDVLLQFSRRIAQGLRTRLMHGLALLEVSWRWKFGTEGMPHSLPAPLIVSLTSYPARFGTLARTLKCLLRQSVKADHTILWIAHQDMPLLPKDVLLLQLEGLEIRGADDMKSYKKILPAVDAFPQAFIATADDDLYYPSTWLEELADETGKAPATVACHRAHEITLDAQGYFNPYDQWRHETRRRGQSELFFPTSGGGVLYPPGILRHSADDRRAAQELCPDSDDIWLYWVTRRNGAAYKTVGRWRKLLPWVGSQRSALWRSNVHCGGNDRQIQNMMRKYGIPGPSQAIAAKRA